LQRHPNTGPDLASMLAVNGTLERLNLQRTQIDDDALSMIGNAIETHYLQNPNRVKMLVECEYYNVRPSLGWVEDLHEMSPAGAKLFFLSLQSPSFLPLRELVLRRPISQTGLQKVIMGIHNVLGKILAEIQNLRARGGASADAHRVTFKRDVMKEDWKVVAAHITNDLKLSPNAKLEPGRRIEHDGYHHWLLGDPDDNNEVILVRGVQLLTDSWTVPKLAEKNTAPIYDEWKKGVREAQQSLQLPAFMPHAEDFHVLDTLCNALCSNTQTSSGAEAGVETLIVDGLELPVASLRTKGEINLSKLGFFNFKGLDQTGMAHDQQGFRSPLRALSIFVVGKLVMHNPRLKTLDLSNSEPCHIAAGLLDEKCLGFAAVCDVLCDRENKLRSLRLANCRLPCKAAVMLARALESTSMRLEELSLCGNAISDVGARALCAALESNTTITYFDLADNCDDAGGSGACEALKHMLDKQRSIRELSITGPDLVGGRELFSKWVESAGRFNVTSLTMVGKEFSRMATGELVVEALKGNDKLTSLSVISHQLDGRALEDILQALSNNKTLTFLDFSHNEIDIDMNQLMQRLKTRKPPLNKIALGGNPCITNMTSSGKQRYARDLGMASIELDVSTGSDTTFASMGGQ